MHSAALFFGAGKCFNGAVPHAMKRSVVLYILLLILLAVAVTFQANRSRFLLSGTFGGRRISRPFATDTTPQGFVTTWVSSWAAAAGMRAGELVTAIDGRPFTGLADLGDSMRRARPGTVLDITVRPAGGRPGTSTNLKLSVAATGPRGPTLALPWLLVIMPIFCIALGFWVAAVRIRDPQAWLLLALMLSFAAIGNAGTEFWDPGLRVAGAAYEAALSSTWPIWMFLFALYFSEPLPPRSWRRWGRWLRWGVVIPLAFFAVVQVITSIGAMSNYLSVVAPLRLLHRVSPVGIAFEFAGVGGFFGIIATKWGMARSRDTRRRMQLLYEGTAISLLPLFILSVVVLSKGRSAGSYFPGWTWAAAFILAVVLFPLTLAYVVVVQRAMDLRVVIRQGLRYAFAKGGVNAVQILCGAIIVALVIVALEHVPRFSLPYFLIIAVAAASFLKLRQQFRRMRAWIDRRFFRDAYQAEAILAALGEKVRSIVETPALLETVCSSVSASLHVPQIAVLLPENGAYALAHAMGYQATPSVTFRDGAATVERLRHATEPVRVHFDDRDSWIHWTGITEGEKQSLAELRSQLLLPLSTNEKLMGFMSLGEKRSEEPYSGADVRLLKSVAVQTGLALANAQLSAQVVREVAQRERLNRELEIARDVQERLFPQQLRGIASLDYYGVCRPALGVGGDYYDFVTLPRGRLGVAVGDVSGKGISAALMMASLLACVRGEAAHTDSDVSRLAATVNRLVYAASSDNRYATLFYGEYDPESRALSYVNAGHNPPLLFTPSGGRWHLRRLDEGGTVVGLLESACFRQASVRLTPGSVLVAFTDGISEAMNARNEEWGEVKLIRTIESAGSMGAAELAQRIFAEADAFVQGAQQYDDMTLVILRALGDSPQA